MRLILRMREKWGVSVGYMHLTGHLTSDLSLVSSGAKYELYLASAKQLPTHVKVVRVSLCYYTLLNFNVVIIPCDLLQKCVGSGFSSTVARHGGLMVRVKKGGSLRTKQRLFYLPVPLRKFITLLIYSAPHNKTGIVTF